MSALLEVRDLVKHFASGGFLSGPRRVVHAVNGVDLTVEKGEVVGLVGESGCGKTTLGKTILRLHDPTSGEMRFDGLDITAISRSALRPHRRRMQIVFQDPHASLNPRMTVASILSEAVEFHGIRSDVDAYVGELLDMVGLPRDAKTKYPHEFSGGQRQRIGIARALSVKPDFVVLDEPVSALDVSIQAQILNLLSDLREQLGLTYLFISHDLAVVEHFCDRVLVMYLGRIVEALPADQLADAKHPYTKALLAAVPRVGEERAVTSLGGDVPSPLSLPPGCAFADRCPLVEESCRQSVPALIAIGDHRKLACPITARGL